MPDVIEHTAWLVVRLTDATNGRALEERARFIAGGKEQRPIMKPGGCYVFLEKLPEGVPLEVLARGFVPRRCPLTENELPRGPDALNLELIPAAGNVFPAPCLTLEGRLKGLEELDAVKLFENTCLYREFDARKKVITLFNPHRLAMERPRYAVVNSDERIYETFIIAERISDTAFKIYDKLAGAFSEHAQVAPVIFGSVDEEGNYLLRVRDMYADGRFLARCRIHGTESFQELDFSGQKTVALAEPCRTDEKEVGI